MRRPKGHFHPEPAEGRNERLNNPVNPKENYHCSVCSSTGIVMETDCETSSSQRQLEGDDPDSCCANCDYTAARSQPLVRIATWSSSKSSVLQEHLDAYHERLEPDDPRLVLNVFPSLRDLQQEIKLNLLLHGTSLFDGFITPPMMLGDLFANDGVAELEISRDDPMWQDMLPYYREEVASIDGRVHGVPLLAGNQVLLLYRKDYFETLGLTPPVTWGEYLGTALQLHNQPIGENGESIFGSCMGRMSESACRKQRDQQGGSCQSLSMTYLGMSLAPMTQTNGSGTGWLFDDDVSRGMKPLLDPALDRLLVFLEQQMNVGAPDELTQDGSMNIDLFRQGKCAMTIAVDHPPDLLSQDNVGFVTVPGSHTFYDRGSGTMVECDRDPSFCPYGRDTGGAWGTVNQAPFGAPDMLVGSVSSLALEDNQALIRGFYEFVVDSTANSTSQEQPLTYSALGASEVPGYEDIIDQLTEFENIATPLQVPRAFEMWSDLDNEVYNYLLAGDYSEPNRQATRERVEASWGRTIRRHDDQDRAVPMSIFYEMSLGTFVPSPPSHLYIGTPSREIGWGLGGLVSLMSLFFMLWVWKHQEERVILASQPMFLYLLCGGTFIMSLSIYAFSFEDDLVNDLALEIACKSSMWFYSVGYSMVFSALFSKIWCINRVFRHARNMHRIVLEKKDILPPFLTLLGLNVAVLLVWILTDDLKWVRVPVDEPTTSLNLEEVSTYGYCDSKHYRLFLGIIFGLNLVFSVIALIQAYECRKISTDYGESMLISSTLTVIVEVWIIGLPLLKLLDDDPRQVFFVKVGVVFLTTMPALCLILVPKVGFLRQSLREPPEIAGQDPKAADGQGRRESVSSREGSEDSPGAGAADQKGGKNVRKRNVEMEGIRIIQSSVQHSEEMHRLQKSLSRAEARNKTLNDRLERMQEKMEQYIVSHHPHGAQGSQVMQGGHGSHHFILAARSEQTKLGSVSETDSQDHH